MLVLNRMEGQSIIIDGNIKISILEIKGGRAKIGIDAPGNIKIVREELIEKHPYDVRFDFQKSWQV